MNIAEILKYCPRDYKLYSSLFGEVTFYNITETKIRVYNLDKYCIYDFNHDGTFNVVNSVESTRECMLFPSKDQRDWSKFRLPVKDGDIMMTIDKRAFITNGEIGNDGCPCAYCGINSCHNFTIGTTIDGWTALFYIPASEEAKKELFDKMAEAGYKWNVDTLELEKLEPKFKEGDIIELDNILYLTTGIIKNDKLQTCCLMMETTINVYEPEFNNGLLNIATLATKEKRNKFYSTLIRYGYKYDKKRHKLIEQKFKPFDKVLARNDTNEKWSIGLFSYYDEKDENYPYVCMDNCYCHCIPYTGNEYLLGTTDSPT